MKHLKITDKAYTALARHCRRGEKKRSLQEEASEFIIDGVAVADVCQGEIELPINEE